MDQNKLRTLVFEKTGVKVDSNDPIFALVALNETVLAEAVERHVALIDDAGRRLEHRLRGLTGGADAPADEWEDSAAAPSPAPVRQPGRTLPRMPLLAGAAGVALLSAVAVVAAQSLLARPAPPPAPAQPVQAVLSAEQTAQLARAERLERAIARLDSRTRSKIDNELQKNP